MRTICQERNSDLTLEDAETGKTLLLVDMACPNDDFASCKWDICRAVWNGCMYKESNATFTTPMVERLNTITSTAVDSSDRNPGLHFKRKLQQWNKYILNAHLSIA